MILSSLAVLALSASAAVNPFTHLFHMHPKAAQIDNRVSVQIYNSGISFRDVKVGGQIYTIEAHHGVVIKAPAGTVVYADSRMANYRRGDTIVEVTPQLEKVVIN